MIILIRRVTLRRIRSEDFYVRSDSYMVLEARRITFGLSLREKNDDSNRHESRDPRVSIYTDTVHIIIKTRLYWIRYLFSALITFSFLFSFFSTFRQCDTDRTSPTSPTVKSATGPTTRDVPT